MHEESVSRAKKISNHEVRFEAIEEDRILHESVYWIYQFINITCSVKFVKNQSLTYI